MSEEMSGDYSNHTKRSIGCTTKQKIPEVKKTDIFEACITGKLEQIITAFPSKNIPHPLINRLDKDNYTLLHYAVRYNHFDIVKHLLSCGANPNEPGGSDQCTPVHLAARYKACPTLYSHRKKISPNPTVKIEPILKSNVHPKENVIKTKASKFSSRQYSYDSSGVKIPHMVMKKKNKVESVSAPPVSDSYVEPNTIIGMLVKWNGKLNARDRNLATPLHYATMRRNVSGAEEILSFDTQTIHYKDRLWFTPLHYAAEQGCIPIARLLIENNALLDALNEFDMTPLHVACEEGHPEVAELLLNAMKRTRPNDLMNYVDQKDRNSFTSLHYAAISGNENLISILLGFDAKCIHYVSSNGNTPLHFACSAGNVANVILLVETERALINAQNENLEYPLHMAAGLNRVDIVKYFIDMNVNLDCIDKDMETPLFFATRKDNLEVVKILIENGASLEWNNNNEYTVLHVAAFHNAMNCVLYFVTLDQFEKIQNSWDSQENRPIHLAVLKNNVDMVKLLCNYDAPLESKNDDGYTPLLLACSLGFLDIIRVLLELRSLLVLDEDDTNNTALHLAAKNGFFRVIPVLINAGVSIEFRNIFQETALDVACTKGFLKVVTALIDAEARINVSETSKFTPPLIKAAEFGHADIVSLLINKGADTRRLDSLGRNCIEIAIDENRRDAVIAMLNTSKWEDLLRHVSVLNGHNTSPLRRLINTMPDVAELVLDKCITNNNLPKTHREYKIICNYEFLEDIYTNWGQMLKGVPSSKYWKSVSIFHRIYTKIINYYDSIKYKSLNRYHPLSIIVNKERSSLLGHPIVRYLVRNKWDRFPRYIYMVRLLLMIITISFFTGMCIVSASPPYACDQTLNNPIPIIPGYITNLSSCIKCPYIPQDNSFSSLLFISFGKHFVMTLSIILSIVSICSIILNPSNIMNVQVVLELCSYILALLYTAGLLTHANGDPVEPIQFYRCRNEFRSIGAVALCLMWLSFVLFLSKVTKIGIYVVMYTDIFRTFLQFVPVYFMLVISFAIPFYMLFLDRFETNSYTTPIKAIIKTLVATVGEIEYDTFYNTKNEPPLPVTYFILFLFVLSNSIILMNLLVGLAVDDIQGVQSQAFIKRIGLRIKSCMEVEAFLHYTVLRNCVVLHETIAPNEKKKQHFWSWWVFKANPFSDSNSDRENNTENVNKTLREIKDNIRSLKHQMKLNNEKNQKIESMLEELLKNTTDIVH